nr:unnamed protein product [Callosobruchus analis]
MKEQYSIYEFCIFFQHCVNMVLEKSSALKLFNDQASQLVQLQPDFQEEVSWRTTLLNSKWDSILSILVPPDYNHCDQDFCLDIDHELKCLRQWFKVMEPRLEPLDFRAKYTKTEIETKALELNVSNFILLLFVSFSGVVSENLGKSACV